MRQYVCVNREHVTGIAAEEGRRLWQEQFRSGVVTRSLRALDDAANAGSLAKELTATVSRLCPQRLIVVQPGEWRVDQMLKATAQGLGVELEIRSDRHFLCSREEFATHAEGRKQLRMEFFYRELRRKTGVLMDGDQPVGGEWDFDADNRESFGKDGPGEVPPPVSFAPDEITREVLDLVSQRFAAHPGSLAHFDWPLTPEPLPDFYWTGKTDLNCLRATIRQTLDYGYAHHIQRLMVTGLFAQLLGVKPQSVHEWYLAMYVDAVEWVELPNTLGMSQHADGGLMASKPYVATADSGQRLCFTWRKKWERVWDEVKFCSDRCRMKKPPRAFLMLRPAPSSHGRPSA